MEDAFHMGAEKSCWEWRGSEPGLRLIVWALEIGLAVSAASCLKIFSRWKGEGEGLFAKGRP
jgi:hypothetical protein